jgi:formate hydrogenlyase subunit 4
MNAAIEATTLGVVQLSALAVTAPLLNGLIKSVKARLQLRRGPPLLQGYRDLAKWFGRAEQVADSTSFMHWLAPVVVTAAVLAAALLVPVFSYRTPLTSAGDLIVFVSLLALARAFLTLGGMDSGSAFGQMGSSRELAISALVEPVLLLSLVALAIGPGSTRLGEIVAFGDHDPARFLGLSWALSAAAFAVVLVAETGRIPVDNPDTHLELTMIHEGMLIEYSGRSLGMLQFASMIKQVLLVVLFVNVFLPFGLARFDGASGHAFGALIIVLKVSIVGVGLGLVESAFAKMRLFELPDLIGAAGFSAALGAALRVLFQ